MQINSKEESPMSTPLKTITVEAIRTFRAAGYQESTINEYRKTFLQLEAMASKMQTDCYSFELGEKFRNDTISERTGKYSLYRWKRRNRCVMLFNWYEEHGCFMLDAYTKSRVEKPYSMDYQKLHAEYLARISEDGLRQNTIDSYRNVSCKFLQFLESGSYPGIKSVPAEGIFSFIAEIKKTWAEESLRTALSGLRSFLRYTSNAALSCAAESVRTVRSREIIPSLSQADEERLWMMIHHDDSVTKRDKAILLLGMLAGMRACDIAKLKLSDIDWFSGSISIIQQKTGKPLRLPLLPAMGNFISEYIMEERPKVKWKEVFVSRNAPYRPLEGHSACYKLISQAFSRAGIPMSARACGTRLLRHSAASRLLAEGIPIETIASVLGHSCPDSTEIYLTTDELRLRECALPLSAVAVMEGVLR
jgi:site-specific recombinase XerD